VHPEQLAWAERSEDHPEVKTRATYEDGGAEGGNTKHFEKMWGAAKGRRSIISIDPSVREERQYSWQKEKVTLRDETPKNLMRTAMCSYNRRPEGYAPVVIEKWIPSTKKDRRMGAGDQKRLRTARGGPIGKPGNPLSGPAGRGKGGGGPS